MVQRQRDRRLTRGLARFARVAIGACVAAAIGLAAVPAEAGDGSLFGGAAKALGTGTSAPVAATGASDFDTATARVEAVWTSMPLSVRRAVFVKQKAAGYGIFDQRPNSEFAPGETLDVYIEPVGFLWKPVADGAFTFGLSADLAIKDEDGKTLFDKPSFAVLPLTSREKNREFMLNFDISLTGLGPGSYKAEITLHDLNGPKTTSVGLPFKISGGA